MWVGNKCKKEAMDMWGGEVRIDYFVKILNKFYRKCWILATLTTKGITIQWNFVFQHSNPQKNIIWITSQKYKESLDKITFNTYPRADM